MTLNVINIVFEYIWYFSYAYDIVQKKYFLIPRIARE